VVRWILSLVVTLASAGCGDDGLAADAGDAGDASTDSATRDTSRPPLDVGADTAASDASPDTNRPDATPGPGGSIRFYGNGGTRGDRVLIRIDDPDTTAPGPPIDVGATDFTIDFWLRAAPGDNPNGAISCGATNDWVTSNIIIDRDRHSQPPSYGIGIAGNRLVWAVQGPAGDPWSLCGGIVVTDDAWHHVAVDRRRSDGRLRIWVDGALDAEADGPDGDVSYPDDGTPMRLCPDGLCDYSDPFLAFGAEKHGYGDISYRGLLDEVRISTTLRYGTAFSAPTAPFGADGDTVGLYHFDEAVGLVAADASGASPAQSGDLIRGGDPEGPDWDEDSPF